MRGVRAGLYSIVLSACIAQADVGVTAKIGTLGVGADATFPISENVNLRLNFNAASYDFIREEDAGDVLTDFEWTTYGAMVDWHAFKGSFRFTLGVFQNDNQVDLTGDLTAPVDLGGVEYSLTALTGDITFNDIAPYVGIGFGNAIDAEGRWRFNCDFGLLFQGEPEVDAEAVSTFSFLQPVVDDALQEEVDEIEDDLSFFTIYPVVSIGVSYRF